MILAAPVAPPLIRPMSEDKTKAEPAVAPAPATQTATTTATKPEGRKPEPQPAAKEVGGPPGPEPTRYGDWQYKGRVTDF